MLRLSGSLINKPVLSLNTGAAIATVLEPIINPNNLKIEAWYCQDYFSKGQLILLYQDIREISMQGFVVNDHNVLSSPNELVSLQKTLELHYTLIDKPVVSEHKKRLGKVDDYAVEIETLYIQKLYVARPVLKSLKGNNLIIDRGQIVEITNLAVVVKDNLQKLPISSTLPSTQLA